MNAAQLDVRARLGLSLAMGIVLTLNLALWGLAPVGRILVAAAGLLWLAALWAPARLLGPKGLLARLLPLYVSLVLGVVAFLLATTWGRVIFAILVLIGIATFRRMRRGRPAKVQAPSLTGTVEYGSTNISGTLVQEFTAGWRSELSWVMTDHAGRFELPQVSPGPKAPPLLVRLRPVKPRTLQ